MANDLYAAYLRSKASDSLGEVASSPTSDLAAALARADAVSTNATKPIDGGQTLSPIQRLTALLGIGGTLTSSIAKGVEENIAEAQHGTWDPLDLLRSFGSGYQGIGTALSQALFDQNANTHVTDWTDVIKGGEQLASGKNLDAAGFNDAVAKAPTSLPEAIGGTVANIFLDPLTYVGPGALKGLIKGGEVAAKAAEAGGDITKALGVGEDALGTLKNARPHGGSNRLAIGATPEGVANDGTGQLLLPGTRVPSVTPEAKLSVPGDAGEIPAGDYQLPNQLNFPGMTGRQTRPRPSQQQGTLFGSADMRAEPPVAPQLPVDLGFIDQQALFNFNPNPKVQGVVPNIAAYPPKLKPGAIDINSLQAAREAHPVSPGSVAPESLVASQEAASGASLVQGGGVAAPEPIVAPTPVPAPPAGGADKGALGAYTNHIIRNVIGTKDIKPTDNLIGELAGKPIDVPVLDVAKMLNTGKIPKHLEGVKFTDANGVGYSVNKLVKGRPKYVPPVAEKSVEAPAASDIPKVLTPEAKSAAELLATPVVKPAEQVVAEAAAGSSEATKAIADVAPNVATGGKATGQEVRTVKDIVDSHVNAEHPRGGYDYTSGKQVRNPKIPYKFNPNDQTKVFRKVIDLAYRQSVRKVSDGTKAVDKTIAATKAWDMLKAAEVRAAELGHPPMSFSNVKHFPFKLSDMIQAIAKDRGTTPEQFIFDFKAGKSYAVDAMNVVNPRNGSTNDALIKLADMYPSIKPLIQNGIAAQSTLVASEAGKVAPVAEQAVKVAEDAAGNTPIGDAAVAKSAPKLLSDIVHAVSPDASVPVQQSVTDLLSAVVHNGQKPIDPVAVSVERNAAANMRALVTAKIDVATGRSVAAEAQKATNVTEHLDRMVAVEGNSVKDTIGAMSADEAMGNTYRASGLLDTILNGVVESRQMPTVYHQLKGALASAIFVAEHRNIMYNAMSSKFTPEQIVAGFKQHFGLAVESPDEAVSAAAKFFNNRYSSLFGNRNFTQHLHQGNTVVARTGITMETMNKFLKQVGSDFQFQNAKAVTVAPGVIRDYSKGIDWLHSIEAASTKDPLDLMNKLENAAQRAVSEKILFDHLGQQFGRTGTSATHTVGLANHPEFAGLKFEPSIAKELDHMMTMLKTPPKHTPQLLKYYDDILNLWKTSATIYNPSHHANNLMGDTFFAWLAGVPVHYFAKGLKVMQAHPGMYKDLKTEQGINTFMNRLLQGDTTAGRLAAGAKESNDTAIRVISRGKAAKQIDISSHDILNAMNERGALPGFRTAEDLNNTGTAVQSLTKLKPLGGYVGNAAKHLSAGREHYVRISHFMYKTQKYMKSAPATLGTHEQLAWAFDKAAADVRKWHPAGDGMTQFEKQYFRRVIPFYSWTRKAIPLLVESMATHPGKLVVPQKIMYGVAQAQGINGPSIANPFPTDKLYPAWMHALPFGPAATYGVGPTSNGIPGLQGTNPMGGLISMEFGGLPFQGLGAQYLNDPLRGILGSMSPLLRIPAEWGTQHEMQTGAPIVDSGEWAQKQIPMLGTAMRLSNINPLGSISGDPLTQKGQKDGAGNPLGLFNWLTGTGALDSSRPSYQKSALGELTKRLRQANGG